MQVGRDAVHGFLFVILACAAALGCSGAPRGAVPERKSELSADEHAAVLKEVAKYTFEVTERDPIEVGPAELPPGVPPGEAPTFITISSASRSSSDPEHGRVLARIRSDKDYKKLGIKSGLNYVWRSTADAKGETYIVPEDTDNRAPVWDKGKKRSFKHEGLGPPQLLRSSRAAAAPAVAFAACVDDPGCGTGHCGYSEK